MISLRQSFDPRDHTEPIIISALDKLFKNHNPLEDQALTTSKQRRALSTKKKQKQRNDNNTRKRKRSVEEDNTHASVQLHPQQSSVLEERSNLGMMPHLNQYHDYQMGQPGPSFTIPTQQFNMSARWPHSAAAQDSLANPEHLSAPARAIVSVTKHPDDVYLGRPLNIQYNHGVKQTLLSPEVVAQRDLELIPTPPHFTDYHYYVLAYFLRGDGVGKEYPAYVLPSPIGGVHVLIGDDLNSWINGCSNSSQDLSGTPFMLDGGPFPPDHTGQEQHSPNMPLGGRSGAYTSALAPQASGTTYAKPIGFEEDLPLDVNAPDYPLFMPSGSAQLPQVHHGHGPDPPAPFGATGFGPSTQYRGGWMGN